ncbi:hypothetical protein IMZ48_33055 [Candidatus Bathyarchaeota archaeon]|nr:hypothetical protein [Candidatus Bathyarchaeota archaeon]
MSTDVPTGLTLGEQSPYCTGPSERANLYCRTSDFVPNDQLFKTIDGIFDQYATTTSSTGEKIARDIVLMGHDLASDDKYLANIGYNMDAKNIVFRADSKDLHQHLRNADQGRGLSAVLFEFGIHAFNLHNAGNDAAYTLRAAVACVIEDMKEQAKPKEAPQEAPQEKKSVEDTGYKSGDSECEDSKQDVTWVPGKTYYYGNDTDDDNLPMVL